MISPVIASPYSFTRYPKPTATPTPISQQLTDLLHGSQQQLALTDLDPVCSILLPTGRSRVHPEDLQGRDKTVPQLLRTVSGPQPPSCHRTTSLPVCSISCKPRACPTNSQDLFGSHSKPTTLSRPPRPTRHLSPPTIEVATGWRAASQSPLPCTTPEGSSSHHPVHTSSNQTEVGAVDSHTQHPHVVGGSHNMLLWLFPVRGVNSPIRGCLRPNSPSSMGRCCSGQQQESDGYMY